MAVGSTSQVQSSSGQALQQLVDSLMTIERQPLNELQARQDTITGQRDAYRTLSSKLSSLRTLVQDFSAPGTLSALHTMKVGDLADAPFQASAKFTASAGRHDIQVQQLAARHGVASQALTTDGTSLSSLGGDTTTAQFQITVGGETHDISVAIESGATDGDILKAVVDAIDSSDAGVQASLVTVGKGQRRLLLQATQGGQDGRIQSITDLSGGLMAQLGLAGSESGDALLEATVVPPSDAVVQFDGVEIRSDSNTLTDVVPGITLTLTSTSDASQVLSVERDEDAAVAKLKELISAFNATIDQIYTLTRPADEDGQSRGILAGTSAFGNLRNALRLLVGQSVDTGGSVSRLADLGITTDRQGRLTLKEADFREVLQSDPAAVEKLFNGENGLAVRLDGYLDGFLKTGGVIDQQRQAAQSRIDLYARRIASTEEGLAAREKSLLQQLAQVQTAIGSLSQQQSYLSSLFSA
ncbi:MAG: flagellar filament capping protein FliD [Candidatus Eisenbacteria bacterium]